MNSWTHEQLLQDLKQAKRLFYRDVPLGSVWAGIYAKRAGGNGTQIADLLDFKPSYTQFCMSIFEVKASRSDFRSDIRTDKWRGYLPSCHRFYFACPSGMVKKDEVPDEAGLWSRGPKGWSCIKRSPVRDITLPADLLMAMIFLRPRLQRGRPRKVYDTYHSTHNDYDKHALAAKKFGQEVAAAMRSLNPRPSNQRGR